MSEKIFGYLKTMGTYLGIAVVAGAGAVFTQMANERKIEQTANEIYENVQRKLDEAKTEEIEETEETD